MFLTNVPRGIQLSKRFWCALMGGLFLLMVLFLYFLHHYAPHKKQKIVSESPVNSLEAESLMVSLKNESGANKRIEHPEVMPSRESSLPQPKIYNKQFMQEAAKASISVYHAVRNKNTDYVMPEATSQPDGLQTSAVVEASGYQAQNQQSEKQQFLQKASRVQDTSIKSGSELPASPYEVKAGTLLPATLQTGIHSDLPGTIIAKLRQDVFDSVTGNYLLIPQGSTLIGQYDSQVAYGQRRVLVAWQRLIFPNGVSQNLEGQAGVDLEGLAGLEDKVDNHALRIFGSAMMFSLFSAGAQLSQPRSSGNNDNGPSPQQMMAGAMGQQLGETGAQLIARNMNVQPTLTIRPGTNFNVLLARDLVLPGSYQYEVSS